MGEKNKKWILVLNVGSATLKYKIFDLSGEEVMGDVMERVVDYEGALKKALSKVHIEDIKAIVHRVVHGGSNTKTLLLSEKRLKELEEYAELAPLHMPPELKVIKSCLKLKVKNYAVFDTAFHQTMPEKAYTYAIPSQLSKKYGIRRYGFHGTNHKYVMEEAAKILKKRTTQLNLITCHLGSGCSMAAIKKGKVIDTTMGLTPMEGLVMRTRAGDIDSGIILYLQKKEELSPKKLDELLNNKSGILGISGKADYREITNTSEKASKLALDVFCYRASKYIGAYAVAIGGINSIAFTGGVGQNSRRVREKVLEGLDFLGIKLDKNKNKKNKTIISSGRSKIKVLVIPANEELMMFREVKRSL